MKSWKCDLCEKIIESKKYPEDWFIVKVYSKPQKKGGTSKGYHLCKKCKEEVFGK